MHALQCKPVSLGTTADASRRGSLASADKLPVRNTPTISGGMLHLGISSARNQLALRESLHSRLRSGIRILVAVSATSKCRGLIPRLLFFGEWAAVGILGWTVRRLRAGGRPPRRPTRRTRRSRSPPPPENPTSGGGRRGRRPRGPRSRGSSRRAPSRTRGCRARGRPRG